jgi:hypothetical protein
MFHNIFYFVLGLVALIGILGLFAFIAYIVGGGFKKLQKSVSSSVLNPDEADLIARDQQPEVQLELFGDLNLFSIKPSF